jgi:beta-galactosidase
MGTKCRLAWLGIVTLVWAGTLIAAQVPLGSSARTYVDLDAGWRFSKGDFATATMPAFDDSGWRTVHLPHDWSIEGPFGPQYGSGNGYAPGGIGWYRKHFTLDAACKDKLVAVEFDGVYDHAEVWINGHFVGGRPYGYSSFPCDLTPLLRFGADENVLAVRVDHSRFADSRWYTGSGIYRHVRLRITDKLRIGHWGTCVTTPEVTAGSATVRVETAVENGSGLPKGFSLQLEVISPEGQVAGSATQAATVGADKNLTVVEQITLAHPQLWSPQSPTLYALKSRLMVDATVVDETSTPFGIRTLQFDPDQGFFLNGRSMKIKGVCIHHEAGCLGAAVPDQVLERRLRLLKELGANAIRTSHNPPAPELLDLCDRLGLLVKDEAFDEFTPAKNKWVSGRNVGQPSRFGYAELFDRWSVIDVQDMVRRDRNHPCVILWSIGNEIDYANDPFSHPVLGNQYRPANPPAQDLVRHAQPLIEAIKKLDTTRPVTAALANVAMSDAVGLGEILDVVGYNYQEGRYAADHRKYPRRFLFGSENSHQFNNWTVVRDNDYVAGQFLWTGIDYLGEANRWPNRGSSAGVLDVCGFKKPGAWFRQSLWSDQPMIYLCAARAGGGGDMRPRGMSSEEHWNWSPGASVTVICYTNLPEVRLTLNDKEIGAKRLAEAANGALTWQIPFAPGTLKAVGLKEGKALREFALTTAGPARRIELVPDVAQVRSNAKDICHVEFRIVDDKGVRVPDAGQEVTFEISGPAVILGIGNADLNSPDGYQGQVHKAYRGRGLAILRSTPASGSITLKATSPGLESATLALVSR